MREDTGEYLIHESFNEGTRCVMITRERSREPAMSPREVFIRRHDALRSAYAETTEYTYLFFAAPCNGMGPVRTKVVRLEPGVFSDLIVGRHTECGLCLSGDTEISLRHVLVRMFLRPSDLVPVFKVLDLCTETGLQTVDGKKTTGIMGARHGMFLLGDYVVFMIYNDDDAWPDDWSQAWDRLLPEALPKLDSSAFRSFDDFVSAAQIKPRLKLIHSGIVERLEGMSTDPNHSCFAILRGPEFAVDDSPGPAGTRATLLLRSREKNFDLRIALKESQLRRGVLIGRYDRCELGGARVDFPSSVSRVHLILIEDEGRFFAIDAASTCGSSVAAVNFTTRELMGEVQIEIAETTVTWKPVDASQDVDGRPGLKDARLDPTDAQPDPTVAPGLIPFPSLNLPELMRYMDSLLNKDI